MLENAYAVIMAGGRGERFWPLSTSKRPKQFLALVGGKPLLALAVERLHGLLPPERILIITHADHVAATRKAAPRLPRANVIGEPVGRDTAAACALGLGLVKARNPKGVFCVLTADQLIGNVARFQATLRASLQIATASDRLITIGIPPGFPSTGFGYIEAGSSFARKGGIEFLAVRRFVEKPNKARAERFVAAGRYYWNSGMFIWSVAAFEQALAAHRPQLRDMAERLRRAAGSRRFDACLRREYRKLERISVDYAVMEKAGNILVAKGTFAWDDVGSWPALANHIAADADGNVVVGACQALEARHNLVLSEGRLTALLGVDDLVVVHSDRATLICPRSRAQDVKKLVQRLARTGRYEELL